MGNITILLSEIKIMHKKLRDLDALWRRFHHSSVLLDRISIWPFGHTYSQIPIVPCQAKAAIRELLPSGLRESISKVRSSVAYAVSAIAHWDWPEAWPQLFTLLMEMLVSGDVNAVHGAMRVLTGKL